MEEAWKEIDTQGWWYVSWVEVMVLCQLARYQLVLHCSLLQRDRDIDRDLLVLPDQTHLTSLSDQTHLTSCRSSPPPSLHTHTTLPTFYQWGRTRTHTHTHLAHQMLAFHRCFPPYLHRCVATSYIRGALPASCIAGFRKQLWEAIPSAFGAGTKEDDQTTWPVPNSYMYPAGILY